MAKKNVPGRPYLGETRKISIGGLSPELVAFYDSIDNKSAYFRSLFQQDFDKKTD